MMRTAAVLVLSFSVCAALSADNWQTWRGPGDSGVSAEKDLPVTWSDTQNVAWQAPLRGLGVSTPIVWGARVFVTSQEGIAAARRGSHPTLIRGSELSASGETTLGGHKQGDRLRTDDRVRFVVTALDRET